MGTPKSGGLNLAMSGIILLVFMIMHLFQFRFGDTRRFQLCAPNWFISLTWDHYFGKNGHIIALFWQEWTPGNATAAPTCSDGSFLATEDGLPGVRDIYRLEFELFKVGGWVWFYFFAVCTFCTHVCIGWTKAINAPQMEIPHRHQARAAYIGIIATLFVGLIYISFPLYCYYMEESFSGFSAESIPDQHFSEYDGALNGTNANLKS